MVDTPFIKSFADFGIAPTPPEKFYPLIVNASDGQMLISFRGDGLVERGPGWKSADQAVEELISSLEKSGIFDHLKKTYAIP